MKLDDIEVDDLDMDDDNDVPDGTIEDIKAEIGKSNFQFKISPLGLDGY